MSVIAVRLSTRAAGTCRGCHAPIVWYRTKADRLLPLNADVVPLDASPLLGEGEYGHIDSQHTHWATCPVADTFRRPR